MAYKGVWQGFPSLQHSEAATECPDQTVIKLLFEVTPASCLKLVCLGSREVGGVIGVLFNPKNVPGSEDCSASQDPYFTGLIWR